MLDIFDIFNITILISIFINEFFNQRKIAILEAENSDFKSRIMYLESWNLFLENNKLGDNYD